MMSLKWPIPLKHLFFTLRLQIRVCSTIFVLMDQTVGVGTRETKTSTNTKNGIPKSIVEFIKPVFQDLSKTDLLSKCTHGLTQNVNECLNGLIWDRCPKSTYVEKETVALATYLAILKFKDGDISFLKIFSELDIVPGIFTSKVACVAALSCAGLTREGRYAGYQ